MSFNRRNLVAHNLTVADELELRQKPAADDAAASVLVRNPAGKLRERTVASILGATPQSPLVTFDDTATQIFTDATITAVAAARLTLAGNNVSASGADCSIFGSDVTVSSGRQKVVVVGSSATIPYGCVVWVGTGHDVSGLASDIAGDSRAVVVGCGSTIAGERPTCVGFSNSCGGFGTVIGNLSSADGGLGFAGGVGVHADGVSSVAIGNSGTAATGTNTVSIGTGIASSVANSFNCIHRPNINTGSVAVFDGNELASSSVQTNSLPSYETFATVPAVDVTNTTGVSCAGFVMRSAANKVTMCWLNGTVTLTNLNAGAVTAHQFDIRLGELVNGAGGATLTQAPIWVIGGGSISDVITFRAGYSSGITVVAAPGEPNYMRCRAQTAPFPNDTTMTVTFALFVTLINTATLPL